MSLQMWDSPRATDPYTHTSLTPSAISASAAEQRVIQCGNTRPCEQRISDHGHNPRAYPHITRMKPGPPSGFTVHPDEIAETPHSCTPPHVWDILWNRCKTWGFMSFYANLGSVFVF